MRLSVIFTFLFLLINQTTFAAPAIVPAAPTLAAKAWLLIDNNSGRVLAEHNSHQRVEPASLTKMMTAYVVLYEMRNGSFRADDQVRVSEKAWRMKGSRMFIEVNTQVSVEELLKGMIIQSGNDATVALAEHAAGTEAAFVELMNQHARTLGMTGTHFTNSTGWPDPDHYTTPYDLAILSRALIRDFPEHYSWYRIKEYTYNNIRQFNRNRLLWLDERVDGIKTGHTESAGYCLVASAQQDDMRLISVVLGTDSENARAAASRKLLNYGFRFYETFLLHHAAEPLQKVRIWKGEQETLPLGLQNDLYITIPRGQRNKVKANMTLETNLVAPAKKGQAYGSVNIMLGDEELSQQPLVALEDVPEGGLWRQLVDTVMLMIK
ncbi:MAG: D-alanyl-D-alanine carboxypeptidase family protein [Gammaproteobacteria bacterium]